MKHFLVAGATTVFAVVAAITAGQSSAIAGPLTFYPEMNKYLVIGTGNGTSDNEFTSFDMSNVEIGADQEIVSTSNNGSPTQRTGETMGGGFQTGSSPSLNGIFVEKEIVPGTEVPLFTPIYAAQDGQRWNSIDPAHPVDTVGIVDILPGSRPIYEGVDYSGNVALTGALAKFSSSNSDVNATIGIQCNRASGCFPSPSGENSYFAGDGDPVDPNDLGYDPFDDVRQNLNAGEGISQFNPTALIDEMKAARDFIVGLTADVTFNPSGMLPFTNRAATSNGIENENIKEDGTPVTTDLDAIDSAGNKDGIAVIDIDFRDVSFLVNNSDWILNSVKDTLAIFRMKEGNQFNFSNSSIVMGDCSLEPDGSCASESTLENGASSDDVIDELGAIFFMDAYQGTNQLFNLNNVILGGVALWDFTDFNPNRNELLAKTNSTGAESPSVFSPPVGDATEINLNSNNQGCSQFISHRVTMSNNRWTSCTYTQMAQQEISEPSALAALGIGIIALGLARRWRPRTA